MEGLPREPTISLLQQAVAAAIVARLPRTLKILQRDCAQCPFGSNTRIISRHRRVKVEWPRSQRVRSRQVVPSESESASQTERVWVCGLKAGRYVFGSPE